jgi:hypothetical protein
MIINRETSQLLLVADTCLDKAYKHVRIAMSDLRDDKDAQIVLQPILNGIDAQKLALKKLLAESDAESDVESYRYTVDGKSTVFSSANH